MQRGSRSGQAARLLLATVLVGFGLWLPSPATGATPDAPLEVTISAMSPAVPERDGTVRLGGTVENTGDEPVTGLQAVFWRSLDPIQDREGMDQALTSRANEPLGSRVKPQEIFQNIPSDTDQTLDPGETADFDLTADVEDFGLPDADGVYLVGVQVRGRVGTDGDTEILGRGRIFMPVVTAPTARDTPGDSDQTDETDPSQTTDDLVPQQLTSVVLLNSQPSLVRTGVLSDDHLAEEVGPGGRLRALLDAAGRPGATFAVDPALVEELETMRRGYQVLGEDDDSVTTGKGSLAAARWLDDFAQLRAKADGFKTLYGSPDLTALLHSSQQQIIAEAKAAGDEVEATKSLRLLVLPGAGRADGDTMAVASTLGAALILVSENTARGATPLLSVNGPTPVVTYAPTVLNGGPGPAPRRTAVKIRQRALAESWLAARNAPAAEPPQQVRLVTSTAQAAAVPTAATSFLQPRTLTSLLQRTPTMFDDDFAYGRTARDAELTDGQLATIGDVRESYTTYVDLFVNPARAQEQRQSILPRTASILFRGEQKAFDRYTDAVDREVTTSVRDKISIVVTPRVQTTGRAAAFPITVRNKLPASDTDPDLNAIKLELRFGSTNSQRLTVAPIEFKELAAGTSQTENAQVRAETNGAVQVTAALYTTTGRPLGESEPILVNATQAGTIGWIIAVVAGAVLVGTTALRIRQVAKERKGEDETEDTAATGHEPAPLPVSRPADEADTPTKRIAPHDESRDRDPLDV